MSLLKRIKDYFIEPVPAQNNMVYEQESNEVSDINSEKDNLLLKDINVIHKTVFLIGNIKPDEILVTRNIFGWNTTKVQVKYPGVRVKMPLIKEAYIVDTNDLIIDINDLKSGDGKYRQSIGIGEDIEFTMRITMQVADEPDYVAQLVKQQNSYKSAIRKTSERLMRLLINDKLLVDDITDENIYDNIAKATSKGLEFNFARNLDTSNEIHNEMMQISADLLQNYGIVIKDIAFPDIDISQNLKNKISERINQQNELKMRKQKADTDKIVAEKEAEALKSKEKAKIEMLKKTKEDLLLSGAQMAEILNRQSMPAGSVFISSNQNDNLVNYMAANAAYDQVKNRPKENGGRSL